MNNLVSLVEKNLIDVINAVKILNNEKKNKQEIEKSVDCTQFYKAAVIHKLQPGVTQDQVTDKKSIS